MIRRTDLLNRYLSEDFTSKANKVLSDYPADLLARAIQYLYTKETKSSYAIEKEVPDSKKSERFVQILKNAGAKDYLEKNQLTSLQNEIVDPRFIDKDYRQSQNYIGETLLDFSQKVHYISPKPNDVPQLMDFLKELRDRGIVSNSHPYALAVAVSYLFVFIHPFEDGNGRIHRFLLHDILNRFSFTPKGFIFPISATLLRQKEKYDHMLESVSEPLMSLINYDLDEDGQLTVREETAHLYRYVDLTVVLESMFEILTETIEKDLAEELAYLANFDINMEKLKAVVDMPNKQLNLFIRLCLQNGGKLSAGKRKSMFPELTDSEILALEHALIRSPSPKAP
jgi:Fic family protein